MALESVKNKINHYINETDKVMLYMDYPAYSGGSDIRIYIDKNSKKYVYQNINSYYINSIDYSNNTLPLTGWTLSGSDSAISFNTSIQSGDWSLINGEGYRDDVNKMILGGGGSADYYLVSRESYKIPVGNVKYSDYLNGYENKKIVKIFSSRGSFASIAYNFAAIRADGSAFISGTNTGINSIPSIYVNELTGQVKKIGMGQQNIVVLKENGNIISWGRNTNNQLNFNITTGIKDISIEEGTSMVLTNTGSAHYFGSSLYGNAPERINNIKRIFNQEGHFAYITTDNEIQTYGRLRLYNYKNNETKNKEIINFYKKEFSSIINNFSSFVLDSTGQLSIINYYLSINSHSGLININPQGFGDPPPRISGLSDNPMGLFAIDHQNRLFLFNPSFTGFNLYYYIQTPIKEISSIFLLTGTF